MKILVYGINYSPELTGIGKYTGEMVEWLAAQGHEVRVITAPPYYPQWQVGENYSAWRYKREEGAATVWRCPLYVPKQPSTLKRLLHLGSFAASSFFPLMAQRRWKPDRIIGVVPTLFCTPGMRLLAKLSGARTVLHIQDYEVDAMLGLGLAGKGKGGKVAQLATAFERSGLHNVDNVSTISRSMMNKAIEKGGLEQLGFARRLGRPHRGGLRGTRAQHGRIRPLRQRQPVRHVVRTGHRVGVAGRQRGRSAQRYVVRTAGQRIRQRRNDPRLQDHLYPPRGGGRPGSLE